jgi:hypothetical protein
MTIVIPEIYHDSPGNPSRRKVPQMNTGARGLRRPSDIYAAVVSIGPEATLGARPDVRLLKFRFSQPYQVLRPAQSSWLIVIDGFREFPISGCRSCLGRDELWCSRPSSG